jgi:hypothetical protein
MTLAEFVAHAMKAHGFDFSGVGYPQPLDVEYHRYYHTHDERADHTHDNLDVDWGV